MGDLMWQMMVDTEKHMDLTNKNTSDSMVIETD